MQNNAIMPILPHKEGVFLKKLFMLYILVASLIKGK